MGRGWWSTPPTPTPTTAVSPTPSPGNTPTQTRWNSLLSRILRKDFSGNDFLYKVPTGRGGDLDQVHDPPDRVVPADPGHPEDLALRVFLCEVCGPV